MRRRSSASSPSRASRAARYSALSLGKYVLVAVLMVASPSLRNDLRPLAVRDIAPYFCLVQGHEVRRAPSLQPGALPRMLGRVAEDTRLRRRRYAQVLAGSLLVYAVPL